MENIQIVSIEGNIGSGKSTFLKQLEAYFLNKGHSHVIFVDEPVDEWNDIHDKKGDTILKKFYEDSEKYSFPFQMMAFITRYTKIKKAFIKAMNMKEETIYNSFEKYNPIIVTERCLYTDKYVFAQMLYDDKKIEEINYIIYNKWFDEFARELPVHKIIYIDTKSNMCHERIAKRSRNGESNIPLTYLENCEKYHNSMVQKRVVDGTILYKIDGNRDMNDKLSYDNLLEMSYHFINK
jgi:deoxyadenosine/deoxycytidine kinase